jgi:predicted DNA-binding transcriptional regulator YafY
MARSTQAQRAERVRAAQELLARGTSMVEAAAALSRDFGLSRRQAYRYLEEAQAVASPPTAAPFVDTLRIPVKVISHSG